MQSTMETGLDDIRNRVADILNRLAARNSASSEQQEKVAAFGQIAAGLAIVDAECLPPMGAGYGSTVFVRDVDTGETEQYTLMVGSLVDIDTQQVSLASPIGQALVGHCEGDEVAVVTPHRRSRLLITKVVTLLDKLDAHS